MSYAGVKFNTIIESNDLPTDQRIEALRKWCRIFHQYGLAPHYPGGTHGNMSFRLKNGKDSFIITAARTSFAGELTDDSFFRVNIVLPDEMKVFAMGDKKRKPSSETLLHHAIYVARPDVHAILHGHCIKITGSSVEMGIPTTKEVVESGTMRIVDSVMEILDKHRFIEIKDHGFLSMGETIEEAGNLAMAMLKRSQDH